MRYRAIQEHDRRDPIRRMCRTLTVSTAGYTPGGSGPRAVGRGRTAPCVQPSGSSITSPVKRTAVPAYGTHYASRGTASASIASPGSCVGQGFGPKLSRSGARPPSHLTGCRWRRTRSAASSRSRLRIGCGPATSPRCGPPRAGSTWP